MMRRCKSHLSIGRLELESIPTHERWMDKRWWREEGSVFERGDTLEDGQAKERKKCKLIF